MSCIGTAFTGSRAADAGVVSASIKSKPGSRLPIDANRRRVAVCRAVFKLRAIFCGVAFFITIIWSSAMEREPIKTDPDGITEVWRAAEQRRAEDISGWLGQWFERRQLKVADDGATNPRGHRALGSAKA
jgi:hypothetical protein